MEDSVAVITSIHYKTLAAGTALLAAVRSVTLSEVTVSLPDGQSGVILFRDVSSKHAAAASAGDPTLAPALPTIFTPGQFITCAVLPATPARRIALTTCPAAVNAGLDLTGLAVDQPLWVEVATVEETGYYVHMLGPDGRPDRGVALPKIGGVTVAPKVWLPLKECPETALAPGHVLMAAIGGVSEIQVTLKTIAPARAAADVTAAGHHITLDALRPGMRCRRAVVTAELGAGALEVTAWGLAGGVVSRNAAIGIPAPTKGRWVGHDTSALRVIGVDHVGRRFWLSSVPSVVDLQPWAPVVQGDVVSGTVVAVSDRRGVEFNAEVQDTQVHVIVPMKFVSDAKAPELTAAHAVGAVVRARVIATNPMDAVAVAGMAPSIMSAAALSATALIPGQVLRGTVEKVDPKVGVVVRLGANILGLVPLNQLDDTAPFADHSRVATTEYARLVASHKDGARVTVRVLEVDKEQSRVILTLRPSLVRAAETAGAELDFSAAWASPADVTPGQLSVGTVVLPPIRAVDGARARGAVVMFYNSMLGIIPAHRLPAMPAGTPVHVRAVEVDKDTGRLVLFAVSEETGQVVAGQARTTPKARHESSFAALQKLYADAPEYLATVHKMATDAIPTRNALAAALAGAADRTARTAAAAAFQATLPKMTPGETTLFVPLAVSPCGTYFYGICPALGDRPARVHASQVTDAGDALRPLDAVSAFVAATRAAEVNTHGRLLVAACVRDPGLDAAVSSDILQLSLRASAIGGEDLLPPPLRALAASAVPAFPLPTAARDLRPGQRVVGYLRSAGPKGVFVGVTPEVNARIALTDLTDAFVRPADVERALPRGVAIAFRVLSVDGNQVAGVARPSVVARPYAPLRIRDITVGAILPARVRAVDATRGIFVDLTDAYPALSALCRPAEALDAAGSLTDSYRAGDMVLARVLAVNVDKKQVTVGLRPSHFTQADLADARRRAALPADPVPCLLTPARLAPVAQAQAGAQEQAAEEASESSEYEYYSEAEAEAGSDDGVALALAAAKDAALEWEEVPQAGAARPAAQDDESDSEDEDESSSSSGSEADTEAEAEVERIRAAALAAAAGSNDLEAEFERRLAGAGAANARTWAAYAEAYVQRGEVATARKVLERARASVAPDDRTGRLTLHVAAVVTEQAAGTQQTFKSAVHAGAVELAPCDFYPAASTALINRGAALAASEMVAAALKSNSYRRDRATHHLWVAGITSMFAAGHADAARAVAASAANALSDAKREEQVAVRVALARAEFLHGEPARGRTVFEAAIAEAPRRSDIWRQYADLEIAAATTGEAGHDDIVRARALLARAAAAVPTKAKVGLYKLWLEFETNYGGETEAVRQAALRDQAA